MRMTAYQMQMTDFGRTPPTKTVKSPPLLEETVTTPQKTVPPTEGMINVAKAKATAAAGMGMGALVVAGLAAYLLFWRK